MPPRAAAPEASRVRVPGSGSRTAKSLSRSANATPVQESDRKFLSFIRAQAEAYLKAPRREEWRGDNSCAEIEGLATAARMLRAHAPADGALLERLETRLSEEMTKIRQLQIPPDTSRRDFGEGIYLVSPKLRDFSGAFLEARFHPSTRVDATAHCVSAMVKLAS